MRAGQLRLRDMTDGDGTPVAWYSMQAGIRLYATAFFASTRARLPPRKRGETPGCRGRQRRSDAIYITKVFWFLRRPTARPRVTARADRTGDTAVAGAADDTHVDRLSYP